MTMPTPSAGTPPGRAPGPRIAAMSDEHAEPVLAIYRAGIDTGHATFETIAPSWESFTAGKLPGQSHVALDPRGRVLGWVAAGPVSARAVYAGVVEHSVYVAPDARGRGVGAALLTALTDSTENAGIWTVQTGIFPENTTSLRLHERHGFRRLGVRERVGRHHGRWRDVVLLERRSSTVGTDGGENAG